ncbi:MAG: GAF domain-containing protein [Symploca sp. SIO1A3]|nr:GAF domain-containing protein [Symploca sp. SIO1A3]
MGRPKQYQEATKVTTYGGLLHRITNKIRQSLELQDILSATVAEMRSFLQTDRVKIYRFHPDASGQVIAESIAQKRLPSLKGLNFPATDIPPLAREMLIKTRQRSIVDVASEQITLSRSDFTAEPTSSKPIIEIVKRSVDPCHIEYLKAMGVLSSLVVPIFYQQRLWGLLVSHHSQPRAFSEQDLELVQLVAEQVSIAIAQSSLLTQAREQVRQETMINQITPLLHSPRPIKEILQLVLERIVRSVRGSGGRLYLRAINTEAPALYTCGVQPALVEPQQPAWLEQQSFWQQQLMLKDSPSSQYTNLRKLQVVTDLYQETELADFSWAFQATSIRGIVVLPLQHNSQESLGCLTIFRNAVNTETLWAGYWDSDERQQRPRKSFEVWREYKKNQAPPWTDEDIELVESIGIHLAMAVMQYQLHELEMHNQELKLARKVAEESSRLKSNFLASTSHELLTPLASTLNYLQILSTGSYPNQEELNNYIQLADKSAQSLVAIINDVLDITKIEEGKMRVELEPVNLVSFLEEQRELFSLVTQRRELNFIISCEVEQIYADKAKLKQVITNLLANAFKFTETGEVRITVIKLVEQPMVQIKVSDTGIGIEMSQKERLLEAFVQEDNSIKQRYGGAGLGLAICKQFVEMMGGHIQLDSPGKGQGTTVTLTYPDCTK